MFVPGQSRLHLFIESFIKYLWPIDHSLSPGRNIKKDGVAMEKKKMFDLYHMVDNLNLLTWQAFDSVALATVLIFDSTFPNCSLLTRPHLTSEPVE